MMKKAFTIVEMMLVLAIIGILLGVVTTAASSSIKQARDRKASACCSIVQQGLATFYAQKGRWPGSIGSRIKNGEISASFNSEGVGGRQDASKYVLTAGDVSDMMKEIIVEAQQGNPMLDISGLFVSRHAGEPGSKDLGMDFWTAVRGTRKSGRKMKVSQMNFGYPEREHGYFRRFKVVYSIPTDEMKVGRQ